MTTIDKQAAIVALGGPEKAREQIRSWLGRDVYLKEHELALRIALAALEGDDGRALLRQLREHVAEWQRLHEQAVGDPTVDQRVLQGYLAIERDVMDKIDRLLAAEPAQSAEPAAPDGDGCCPRCGRSNRWHDTDCDDAPAADDEMTPAEVDATVAYVRKEAKGTSFEMKPAAQNAAAPAGDDEARIAEIMRKHAKGWRENDRLLIDDALLLAADTIRSISARAVKAEGVLRAIDEVIADRGVPERDCTLPLPQRVDNLIVELKNWRHSYGEAALLAEKAETEIRHLRAKLAESEAEVERLRGRDAEPFDWDAAPNVQEWIDENLPEREP